MSAKNAEMYPNETLEFLYTSQTVVCLIEVIQFCLVTRKMWLITPLIVIMISIYDYCARMSPINFHSNSLTHERPTEFQESVLYFYLF